MTAATYPKSPPASAARSVPLPRIWPITGRDMVAILLGNAIFILAMWVRHGGIAQLGTPGGALIAIGQVSGLIGTYLALIQLLLMARMPWLDQAIGMDRLAAAHRWIGFATVWLIAAHGVVITAGYATSEGSSFLGEAWTIFTTF
ncbi:MAG: oxidoreductase, partial [Chloroflexi bacterium]|nr:oxidoreductase [Chloroflexota bacterium]